MEEKEDITLESYVARIKIMNELAEKKLEREKLRTTNDLIVPNP